MNGQLNAKSVDEYIAGFTGKQYELLCEIRAFIRAIVPEAEEVISYGIPTFKLKGNLVHYAAYASHIGFYPGASGIKNFEKKLVGYKTSKGTVQFAINAPIPTDLIKDIVLFRLAENMRKSKK